MRVLAIAVLGLLTLASSAWADLVTIRVPGTDLALTIEGRLRYNPGGTVFFYHPKLGKLVLDANTDIIERWEADSHEEIVRRKMNSARTAEEMMDAADYALSHALVSKVYEAAEEAIKLDPQNKRAAGVLDLQKKMQVDLGDYSEEEKKIRAEVRNDDMIVAVSPHFILLHDTPTTLPRDSLRKKIRSEERLELLELVYESFLLKFYAKGKRLQIPDERLMVVLFHEEQDFYAYAEEKSPELGSAIGFWDPKTNISFFFDHGSSESFRELREVAARMQDRKEELLVRARNDPSINVADYRRRADMVQMLVEIDQENSDIEVVSHECTHQMAGNTGLFPRHIRTPSWMHEGLATYFEAPSEASWSGIGAVNEMRLGLYKVLAEQDTERSNVDFIVGDQIFTDAASHMATLHGYSQAWALTHFLMEKHFDEFMTFYGALAEMPPDVFLHEELLTEIFDDCFRKDREALNSEWHRYMRGLRTEKENIMSGDSISGSFR